MVRYIFAIIQLRIFSKTACIIKEVTVFIVGKHIMLSICAFDNTWKD